MKKLITILLMILMLLPIASCGKDPGVNEEMIKEDLAEAFCYTWPSVDIDFVEIFESITVENTFQAHIGVKTIAKYADFLYELEVFYTKYDQGWKLTEYEVYYEDYELKAMPTAEDLEPRLKQLLENLSDHYGWLGTLAERMSNVRNLEIRGDGELDHIFSCEWKSKYNFKHAEADYLCGANLFYSTSLDDWVLYDDASGEYAIYDHGLSAFETNKDFTGTWKNSTDVYDVELEISNFSWEGFDATYSGKVSDRFGGSSLKYSRHFSPDKEGSYTFTDDEGQYFIKFSFEKDCTNIKFGENGIEWADYVKITEELPSLK